MCTMPLSFINLGPISWPWFVLGVIFIIFLQLFAAYCSSRVAAWKLWYRGLPIFRWLGMCCLLTGANMLMKRHINGTRPGLFMEEFNARIWISPDVEAFKQKDLKV
jgi:hypothetical protein